MRRELILLLALVSTPALSRSQAPRLEVIYLANMGVLVEGGGRRVVIDGFHHAELDGTAAVPSSWLQALEQSRDPFRTLDLVLTTHRHLDHFNATSVAARLSSDSNLIFVAAQETVDSLFARTDLRAERPGVTARVRGVLPPAEGEVKVQVPGIELAVLDLPHNRTRSKRVANVGFVLNLQGLRVLHVGDADPTAANFDPHRLAQRPIDVAIVPFWYLMEENGDVLRSIGARTWIATHVSPSESASVRRKVHKALPGAIVMTTPGQRHAIR
jgi:L-ascorbate metabolism protein UlaG (beta-lactamase superfamily)